MIRLAASNVFFGALTGQSATVFPFHKWGAVSEDILEVVTSLSDAFDKAVELLSAAGIWLVTAVAHRVSPRVSLLAGMAVPSSLTAQYDSGTFRPMKRSLETVFKGVDLIV